jgi:glycine dehydrogenase subunit 1
VSPIDVDRVMKALEEKDILGGLPLPEGAILWCATEMNSKEQIDMLIEILMGVGK